MVKELNGRDTILEVAKKKPGSEKYFRCPCGCNVFRQLAPAAPRMYRCNACRTIYAGDKDLPEEDAEPTFPATPLMAPVLCTAPGCDEEVMPGSPYCCRSCMGKAQKAASDLLKSQEPKPTELELLRAENKHLREELLRMDCSYDRLHRKHYGIVRD